MTPLGAEHMKEHCHKHQIPFLQFAVTRHGLEVMFWEEDSDAIASFIPQDAQPMAYEVVTLVGVNSEQGDHALRIIHDTVPLAVSLTLDSVVSFAVPPVNLTQTLMHLHSLLHLHTQKHSYDTFSSYQAS
jgi:hypothetical protein